jgi:hypothetical protein
VEPMSQPFEDRAWAELAERDSEIERLKAEVEILSAQAAGFRDMALSHRVLLIRAADALEQHQMVTGELIDELRKAV